MATTATAGVADTAPLYLDADSCASRYGFSPAHWRRLVDAGRAPQPVRLGRLVRWAVRTLDRWEADGCPTCRPVRAGGTR